MDFTPSETKSSNDLHIHEIKLKSNKVTCRQRYRFYCSSFHIFGWRVNREKKDLLPAIYCQIHTCIPLECCPYSESGSNVNVVRGSEPFFVRGGGYTRSLIVCNYVFFQDMLLKKRTYVTLILHCSIRCNVHMLYPESNNFKITAET